ncbi:AEC family transporter [Rhodobacteraceae bacterium]|nr:AEC family transporter [Paracoccaceae bacterium]
MIDILLKTLPFFAVIGLGYLSGRRGFFTPEATGYLTKFVFYFALSAFLFRFSATLPLSSVLQPDFIFAYLSASALVYGFALLVALGRKVPLDEAAIEAHCAVIGNVGFLGVPMLALLMGPEAIGYVVMVLAVDLILFGSLIVMLIVGSRDGQVRFAMLWALILGLLKNPMIMSISAGFIWSGLGLPILAPLDEFLSMLGSAATPGALFAIGASLAFKSAERLHVAAWISFLKLIIHPAAVVISALFIFQLDSYAASVMLAAAALPVAGNVYILAQHYAVAPVRVSASILISTFCSILTVPAVIAWLNS